MQYYERNEEAMSTEKERLAKAAAQYGVDAPLLYALPGSTMVRILPPYGPEGKFFRQIYKHRVPTSNRPVITACPKSMAQLSCPICEKGKELVETRDESNMKFAREHMKPRQQFLYNVICVSGPADREGKPPDPNQVYVMEVGVMTHQQIIGLDQDEAMGWANLSDPAQGVTLAINRTGQGLDTKYDVNPTGAGRTNIFEELASRGVNAEELTLYNLDEVYKFLPDERLEEIAADISIGGFAVTAKQSQPQFKPAATTNTPPAATPAPAAVTNAPPVATPAPVATSTPVPIPQPITGSGQTPAQPASPGTAGPVIPEPPVNS